MSKSSTAGANISSSGSSHDLIDAKLEEHQLCAGSKQCPGCGHKLETKPDWVGLPAGVKFDPTDQELIEHLEAKVEAKDNIKSHPLIDEFIPTIEGEDGICYTHPEKLPGVTRDGLSRHFFHRPSKAYTTGTRKRRKIQTECDLQSSGSGGGGGGGGGGGETRWHKTGKTRPVMVNGKQKGCKKILVLYTNFGKNRKPEKTNWVMHQYHLGVLEEEKEGELVVSKIFYQTQPRQCNWSDRSGAAAISITTGEAGSSTHDHNYSRRDSTGSGSCSSSKEIVNTSNPQRSDVDQIHATVGVVGAAISSYTAMDMQQFKPDHFGFPPFRKSFDEVGIGEASTARDAPGACDEMREQHQHQQQRQHHQIAPHDHHHVHHQMATTAFHITTPSHPISTIISPPPALHHTASIILDQPDPYHVSRLMLQNEIQQQQQQQQQQHHQQQQQQQHHKLGGRSASGLEELIMGCTSTSSTDHLKEVASIANTQEAEWLKYSTFWQDPDNQDHHHHG